MHEARRQMSQRWLWGKAGTAPGPSGRSDSHLSRVTLEFGTQIAGGTKTSRRK